MALSQKYKFNDFCRNIFLKKSFQKKKKDYPYNKDDGEPGEPNGSEVVVEAIAAKRPLMYDAYNLCEMARRNQLIFLQKQIA